METGIQTGNGVKEREVIGGIRVIEAEYRVKNPIFEDVRVERPVFVDKKVEIPSGVNEMIIELAGIMAKEITKQVLDEVNENLSKAIDARIKEIEVPKITYKEEIKVTVKEVPVTNAVITNKHVVNAVITDKEVVNPVLVDKKIINPIFEDVVVERPMFQDRVVINPKFEDVVINRPKYVDKEIIVIHPKYIDMKGNPEPA